MLSFKVTQLAVLNLLIQLIHNIQEPKEIQVKTLIKR